TGRVDAFTALSPTGRDAILDLAVGGGSPSPSPVRLRDIDGLLWMTSAKPIPVPLSPHGYLLMAPGAVANLRVTGNVGGSTAATSGAATGRTGLVIVSLERATVQEGHLSFGGSTVDTGAIEITQLRDCRLTFSGFEPRLLSGRITRATAKNI